MTDEYYKPPSPPPLPLFLSLSLAYNKYTHTCKISIAYKPTEPRKR